MGLVGVMARQAVVRLALLCSALLLTAVFASSSDLPRYENEYVIRLKSTAIKLPSEVLTDRLGDPDSQIIPLIGFALVRTVERPSEFVKKRADIISDISPNYAYKVEGKDEATRQPALASLRRTMTSERGVDTCLVGSGDVPLSSHSGLYKTLYPHDAISTPSRTRVRQLRRMGETIDPHNLEGRSGAVDSSVFGYAASGWRINYDQLDSQLNAMVASRRAAYCNLGSKPEASLFNILACLATCEKEAPTTTLMVKLPAVPKFVVDWISQWQPHKLLILPAIDNVDRLRSPRDRQLQDATRLGHAASSKMLFVSPELNRDSLRSYADIAISKEDLAHMSPTAERAVSVGAAAAFVALVRQYSQRIANGAPLDAKTIKKYMEKHARTVEQGPPVLRYTATLKAIKSFHEGYVSRIKNRFKSSVEDKYMESPLDVSNSESTTHNLQLPRSQLPDSSESSNSNPKRPINRPRSYSQPDGYENHPGDSQNNRASGSQVMNSNIDNSRQRSQSSHIPTTNNENTAYRQRRISQDYNSDDEAPSSHPKPSQRLRRSGVHSSASPDDLRQAVVLQRH